jgi:hypothetical protein
MPVIGPRNVTGGLSGGLGLEVAPDVRRQVARATAQANSLERAPLGVNQGAVHGRIYLTALKPFAFHVGQDGAQNGTVLHELALSGGELVGQPRSL